jgi:hypothetical protein
MLVVTACEKSETAIQPAGESPQPAATSTATAPSQAASPIRTGTVIETMDSGGYSYMHVDLGEKQEWVAIPVTTVTVGQRVSYNGAMVMPKFRSKTLDREFDEVVFAGGIIGQQAAPVAGSDSGAADSFTAALGAEGAPAMSPGSQKSVTSMIEVKVDKAEGANAYSVGELFTKAAELNGQAIKVRGKVMKVSENIMGRNWIHLQDGSGSPDDNSHDLVVTTSIVPDPSWDIVTVEGVLAADKDFGAGYKYAAIVEEATITQ